MESVNDTEYDISVIIPVYNSEEYIGECIQSILRQTKKEIQIVVVNDGSTDATEKIVEDLCKNNPNIKLINQKNQGVKYARVTGLNHADGEYIGWVDSDDFIHESMYETLYSLAMRTGAECVYCDYRFYPEKVKNKGKWFKEYHGKINGYFIDRNSQLWNKLMKKTLLERIRFQWLYPQISEYANISVLLNAKGISYTKERLYYYRVGQNSLSGGSLKGKLKHYQEGVEYTKSLKQLLIQNTKYEKKLDRYFDYRYIYTLLLVLLVAAYNKDRAAYVEANYELKRINYKNNIYLRPFLDEYYGVLKSVVIRRVIPVSYTLAGLITKNVF